MTKTELKSEALQLPVEDRLELAEALWESLEQDPVQPELPLRQREILDERLAAGERDSDALDQRPSGDARRRGSQGGIAPE